MVKSAAAMTDGEIAAELEALDRQWSELRAALEESGGHSGSPGEWMVERMWELEGEQNRRDQPP